MTRKEIRKLTSALCNYAEGSCISKEEREQYKIYWNAVRSQDIALLRKFAMFGTEIRKQIENLIEYKRGLLYGFNDIEFNEYGWLKRAEFVLIKEISFKIKEDKLIYNHLKIFKGKNENLTFGIHYIGPTFGGFIGANVFDDPFETEQKCINAGLLVLKNIFVGYVNSSHSSISDKTYCRKVLPLIEQSIASQKDYITDKKGQILLF